MSLRPVKQILQTSTPTIEGAGIKLQADGRSEFFGKTKELDAPIPKLLLDDFRNEHPKTNLKGFTMASSPGDQTITYVYAGTGGKTAWAKSRQDGCGRCAMDDRAEGSGILPPEDSKGQYGGPHAWVSAVGQACASGR